MEGNQQFNFYEGRRNQAPKECVLKLFTNPSDLTVREPNHYFLIINLTVISSLSIIVPVLLGAILFRRLNPVLRLLACFLFVSVLFEGIAFTLYNKGMNNLFLFHAYAYVELGFITTIFYRLTTNSNWRLVIKLLIAGFLVFSAINLILFESIFEFNANQRYLECIIILVLCIGYFTELIHKAEHIYLEKNPYFWLASTYLIYFAGNSLLFLFYYKLSDDGTDSYWDLHSTLNLCLNLGSTVVLWMGRKTLI